MDSHGDNETCMLVHEEATSWKKLSVKKLWEESKKVWSISLPSIVFRVTSFSVLIVTQSFIGHISSVDLAAYALVQSITLRFAMGIILGMSSATETLCGQAFGAKQYHMMGIYLQRSWIVDLTTATITLPVYIFAAPLFKLLGEADTVSDASEAISLWIIGVVYNYVFSTTLQMYLQAQMKNAIIAWVSLGSFLLHLFVTWLFVSKLGFGVSGAMGALNLSVWAMVGAEMVYVFGGWCGETWKGFSMLAFADLVPVVKLSIASGVMLCLELWYSSILVLIAGYSSNAAVDLSAFSICLNIYVAELMISLGFMTAACVRVSNEIGRGDIAAAKLSIKVVTSFTVAVALVVSILCLVFGREIPYLFTSDDEVAETASNLSVFLALSILIGSFQCVFGGVAIGIGAQAKVAVANIISYYIIGLPIGCLLAFVADFGIKGIWIGLLCGMSVEALWVIILAWRIDWDEEVNKAARSLDQFLLDSPQESNHILADHTERNLQ